jgi:endonuclease/exonuclease/phosphatase family metal-dependent hydrolase
VKVATLNLRADANRWQERLPLVVEVLLACDADVIALQEVRLNIDQHNQVQSALNAQINGMPYEVFLCVDWYEPNILANAFLVRIPVLEEERIELPQGYRTAQRILVEEDGALFNIINTHLHHKPYRDERIRLPQMRVLLEWLREHNTSAILMGDLNADPTSATILEAKELLKSAYETVHGAEPDVTFPTPLRHETLKSRCIDYILYSRDLGCRSAKLIGSASHAQDKTLYPSDHYGLTADIIAP